MARLTSNLAIGLPTRFFTWVVIALMALPIVGTEASANQNPRDATSVEMPMECDHDAAVQMTWSHSSEASKQEQPPCCSDCEMPDCATGASTPVLTILVPAAEELPLPTFQGHALARNRSLFSAESSAPRKPPRV